MSGGQNYLLLAMDMAKVGGSLSVVKVCTSMVPVVPHKAVAEVPKIGNL